MISHLANAQPRISVVVPCFDCKETIAECLGSVAQQTYPVFELIAVDDGSTDGTWEALHELQRSAHPSLLILCHENRQNYGSSLTRARGIAAARGDYIALLDADDQFHPSKLEQQLEAMLRHPNVILCHTAVKVFGDLAQAPFFEAAFSGSPQIPYRYRDLPDYLQRNRICNSSVLVHAQSLKQTPASYVGRDSVEDWLCWSLLAAHGSFLYLAQPLTKYHVHPASKTAALTHNGATTSSIAQQTAARLRQSYVSLEFKLVLLARSESSLHGLRVLGSIAEDIRRIVILYLWNPGGDPNSSETLRPNALIRLLMIPFLLARWLKAVQRRFLARHC